MAVETFDLNDISANQSIKLTPKALKHFADRIAKSGKTGILLSLKESGCTGFKYEIEERDSFSEVEHKRIESGTANVYIDKKYEDAFKGTIIDYEQQGLNFQLVLKNPNVQDSCGCGESFNFQ